MHIAERWLILAVVQTSNNAHAGTWINVLHFRLGIPLSKFGCGVAPIRIETGTYENLAEEQRLCVLCNKGEVESEQHTMMRCTFYANEQADLFALATEQNDTFLSLMNKNNLFS